MIASGFHDLGSGMLPAVVSSDESVDSKVLGLQGLLLLICTPVRSSADLMSTIRAPWSLKTGHFDQSHALNILRV